MIQIHLNHRMSVVWTMERHASAILICLELCSTSGPLSNDEPRIGLVVEGVVHRTLAECQTAITD